MARLILRFADRDLAECALGTDPVTIGRLPDSVLVIDNPAVSSRHARVFKEGDQYVLEDLKSTNGTFVNDKPIARHTLVDGDVIVVAKHTLLFTLQGSERGPEDATGPLAGREQATGLHIDDALVPKTAIPTAQGRIGTIRVISGDTGQSEYVLAAVTTMIGKAETAQIRLKGWFKPPMAAAIARKGQGFTITPMGGKVAVNGEVISNRRDLASGDRIDVSGVTLEFTLT